MPDPETNDGDTSHLPTREVVHRAGIVIGLLAAATLLTLLFLDSIVVVLLAFAAILWAVFLRGTSETIARYTPIPVHLGIALVLVTLFGLLVLLGFVSGPSISDQWDQATTVVPKALDQFRSTLQNSPLAPLVRDLPDPKQILQQSSEFWKGLQGIFTGAFGVVGNTLVIFAVGIYIAVAPDKYKQGLVRLFPLTYRGRAAEIIDEAATHLGWWLGARFLTMTAVGILTTVGLTLLDIPLSLLLGILSGLLTFIPVIGPIISGIPAAMMGLFKGPIFMVYVIILYLGVQAIENYLLTPIIGERVVHIPPALLIMAQVLLGLLIGLLGLILATPLLVLILVLTEKAYIQDVLGETDQSPEEVEAKGRD